MKLYYSPGACSLSPHIVLQEAGIPVELVKANVRKKLLPDGSDFRAISPRGQVPVLELDNGERLTEGPAIVQYIADLAPASGLAPAAGTMPRYRLVEWLNFITSELHKGFTPLFNPATSEDGKAQAIAHLMTRLAWVDGELAGKNYLLGDTFTAADAYLFTVAGWSGHVNVDISGFANLGAFMARVAARPAVKAAMQAEGLLKS